MFDRKPLRLRTWDYASSGVYYVTICTKDRKHMFGAIVDGEVFLSQFGEIVVEEWCESEKMRKEIILHEFIVMPNHVHGIVEICRGVWPYAPTQRTFDSPSRDLGSMIRSFKSSVTKRTNILRNAPGEPVWQRSYYDHVIRNDEDLYRIRKYIRENPSKWEDDRYR